LKEQWVNFKVRDVYLPDPQQVLTELHGDDVLQGRVVALSDNELQDGSYAVIEVQGMREPVVVPTKRILGVL
jgi:hypothetical protein